MDIYETSEIYELLARMYSDRTQITHLAGECGNLVYEACKALHGRLDTIPLDYGLLGAMVSVDLALDQVRHNVLTDVDVTKMELIRSARLLRMRALVTPPSIP
jgi:hypothetical protein